ncbi:MAG: hypothetical protein FJ087_02650 [Deltaproteobacteria bacterium]|nr:hypothetical protein [Deltaproteobacteria bacterium]
MKRVAVLWAFGAVACGGGGDGADTPDAPGAAIEVAPEVSATPIGKVTAVSTRDSHTCAIDEAGALWCRGSGFRSQLGDGGANDQPRPGPAALPAGDIRSAGAGGSHTCAAREGALLCWGPDFHGQAGDESMIDRFAPHAVGGITGTVAAVAAGLDHTCAIADSRLWCFGRNDKGQLGAGPGPATAIPKLIP